MWKGVENMMYMPQQVNIALAMLSDAGYEAYLVGGAVRDYVRINKKGHDWDITTNALPEEVKRVFSGYRIIETGLKHGTVTVVIDHEPLEITTYRIDGSYTDHRRPDAVRFTRKLQDDVARRDFTMNALAYNPAVGLVDLTGGVSDIQSQIVRCVGDPDRRFQEDALRILRALRFASVLGFEIEEKTADAARKNKILLKTIAVERIREELTKMLCGDGVKGILTKYADILAVVMPEIVPMFGFEQHNPHHNSDVWMHTVKVVSNSIAEPVMRWTALLHDIGKPHCFSIDALGVGHFYGHAGKSACIADTLLQRLRFDNASRERIVMLVKNHDTPLPTEESGIKRLMNRLGPEAALQIVDMHRADTAGQHPDYFYRYDEFDAVQAIMQQVLDEQTCFSLKDLAMNGHDLIEMGVSGKRVGEILQIILNAVMDGEVANENSELRVFVEQIIAADRQKD